MSPSCQTCGIYTGAGPTENLCAACLLRSALQMVPDESAEEMGARSILPRPFGTYELLEEIGRGGMGVVFRARQTALNRLVAVKLLISGAYSSEAALRRFQVEAAAAAGLQHVNIVAVHDYGEIEGQPFYAMELVERLNLSRLSDGRPLLAAEAVEILRVLAGAVHYAHQRGILHRDLKPSNVLIDEHGRARITDFGLAKRLDEVTGVTLTGQILGSPNYASPEQLAGHEREVGPATDVYGLGAILYHLVTGRAPFAGPTAAQTVRMVLESEPVSPALLNPALPRDLTTICLKCLSKEVGRRYSTAAELRDDCEFYLKQRPIRAQPPTLLYRINKYARRNRTTFSAAIAVVLAIGAGVFMASLGLRRAVAQERAALAARSQAETLVSVLMRDAQPALEPYGRLPVMGKMAEASLHYFEQLPPELQSSTTDAARATLLDSLALVHADARDDRAREAKSRASELWEKIQRARPSDPDVAANLLSDRIQMIYWFGHREDDERLRMENELIARFREWRGKFPLHAGLKLGLARILVFWSYNSAGHPDHERTLARALEAHQLSTELMKETPDDAYVRSTYVISCDALSSVYCAMGNLAEGIRIREEALGFAEKALQSDPGNVMLLNSAAMTARALGETEQEINPPHARSHLTQSQHYFETLTRFDPSNERWRMAYANSFSFEANYLWKNGRPAAARRIFADIQARLSQLGILRPLRTEEWIGPEGSIFDAGIAETECAAQAGDRDGALALFDISAKRGEAFLSTAPPGGENRGYIRSVLGQTRIHIAEASGDWDETIKEAQKMNSSLVDLPHGSLWDVNQRFHWAAMRSLGAAHLARGEVKTAISLLNEAQNHLGDSDDLLAEALIDAGECAKASPILQAALRDAEADHLRDPELWDHNYKLARTLFLLARTIDSSHPENRARRQFLLDRAESLSVPAEEGSCQSKTMRALMIKIDTLRASEAPAG